MSVKISGQVWELDLDPMDKLVLLALSDHADHEGQSVKPGNALLCAKTGLSEKTIGVKIAKFLELGILEPVETTTGRGNIREFAVELSSAERHPYFIEKDRRKVERASTNQASKRSNLTPQKVELDAVKVELDGFAYKEHEPSEPSIEPSEREREPNSRVSFVKDNHNQPFSPNDDFDTPPPVEWTIAERFVLKACDLWDALADQEKPTVEANWRTKQSVQSAGKYVMPRLNVENRIGGTPKLFREFWHDKLKREVAPRPDYLVEQWEAYDRWLIENYETHRRITNAA